MQTTEAIDRSLDQARRIVESIRPEHMDKPTPCSEFDVRALLNHLVVSIQQFTLSASGKDFDFSAYGNDVLGDDPNRALVAAADALRAATRDSDESKAALPIMEITQHSWDLAKAIGQTNDLDDELAETALELARTNMPPDDKRPEGVFGKSVPIADSAPAPDRFAAFMGRTP